MLLLSQFHKLIRLCQVPGNIRRAEHFVAFLRRFVAYLKEKLGVNQVETENPTTFLAQLQERLNIDGTERHAPDSVLTHLVIQITAARQSHSCKMSFVLCSAAIKKPFGYICSHGYGMSSGILLLACTSLSTASPLCPYQTSTHMPLYSATCRKSIDSMHAARYHILRTAGRQDTNLLLCASTVWHAGHIMTHLVNDTQAAS